MPAHCGLPGNEQADALTKEATGLIQQDTPFDARTLAGATARRAKRSWPAGRPEGWYRSILEDSEPPRRCGTPLEEVDVHQLQAGHWERSQQYHHRIRRRPTDKCQQCSDTGCPASRCLVCRVAKDIPAHILLECRDAGSVPKLEGQEHFFSSFLSMQRHRDNVKKIQSWRGSAGR